MGSSFWLTRGALPLFGALIAAPGFALPAAAQVKVPAAAPHQAAAPALSAEWWLPTLNARQAWGAAPEQGAGVTVAVLSTGVAPAQQDLTANVLTGPDYTGSGRSQGNPFWGTEGTAVASLIAGHGHGSAGTRGITGVAPLARVLSVRVTLDYKDPLIGHANVTRHLPDAIARGIEYAVSRGAQVIALPLDPSTLSPAGTPSPAAGGSAAERAAVHDALARDVVLVAPAGDDAMAGGGPDYPAAYPGVIAVGATGKDGKLAPYSSTRSYVALTAPGSVLEVAAPGGGYTTLSTTDMAAALTAGVATLVRSRYPGLTAAQVAQAVERGAVPAHPAQPGTGGGALNAAGAVTAAASILSPAGSAPPNPAPAWNSYVPPGNGQPATAGGSGLLASWMLRDAAAGAGALVAALALLLVLTRRRRHRAKSSRRQAANADPYYDPTPYYNAATHYDPGAAPARHGTSTAPRHGKSRGGSHARGRTQADPPPALPAASETAAPAVSSESAAARALTADALFSRNPSAVHPPWEVAGRLGVVPDSGAFPGAPPWQSAAFPQAPDQGQGQHGHGQSPVQRPEPAAGSATWRRPRRRGGP